MQSHSRKGRFVKVAENLYRYSASKSYYAVFRKKGRLIWRSLRTKDRAIANRKLKDELGKVAKTDPQQRKMILAELLAMFEERLGQYDVRTRANKRSILGAFQTTWKHGLDMPVRDITNAQLQLWLAQHRKRMTRTGFNAYVIFIRQLFDLSVAAHVIPESPAAEMKMLKPEDPIRDTPNWQQFHEIVKEIRNQHFNASAQESADIVEFMGLAGIGTAECVHLKGEHIDFKAKRIWLYRHKTDKGYAIPIFPQLKPLLDRLESIGRINTGQRLFLVRNPQKALSNACKRLNYPHFTPRALRRCFITRAIEQGIDFKTIAFWQGHQDGGILIAKTYSHLRSEHSENMAKKLA